MPVTTRARTLRDANELLEKTDHHHREVRIICLPPEAAKESDAEDIDEDDLGEVEPIDVAGELEVEYSSDEEEERPAKRGRKGKCEPVNRTFGESY